MLREKDLRGHIKGDQEEVKKPVEGKTKEEVKKPAEGKSEGKDKEKTDLQRDNQLKSAVDILKSWEVFKRTIKS